MSFRGDYPRTRLKGFDWVVSQMKIAWVVPWLVKFCCCPRLFDFRVLCVSSLSKA